MSLPLNVTDLCLENTRGRRLIDVPELTLAPGAALGIRGPSGAGKSTLLFALAGLMDGAGGQVRWGDQDLLALSSEARTAFRAKHMGLIFQDFLLFEELGAAANAGVGSFFRRKSARPDLRQRADTMLAHLGIRDDARNVASFSGGERQRIAVARALAHDPMLLLADEPTASLDRAAADRLVSDLIALTRAGGKTLIAVSHDIALLDRMDRVIVMEDGKIVEDANV